MSLIPVLIMHCRMALKWQAGVTALVSKAVILTPLLCQCHCCGEMTRHFCCSTTCAMRPLSEHRCKPRLKGD